MKYLYLLLASFLLPFVALAQANYQPGYVVLSSGDTLRGYINSKEWENTPRAIQFKANLSEHKAVEYSPALLKSFEVAGADKYITYSGKISMDPNDVNHAPAELDTTTRQDTVFLKLLYSGSKISLLSNTDPIKQRLFFREQQQQPVELSYHQYQTSQTTLESSIIYKGQLQYLVQKYNGPPKATALIERMGFNLYDIIQVLMYINGDKAIKLKQDAVRLFAGGGIASQSTKFSGDNPFTRSGKSNSTTPFVSLGLDIFQNPQTQKLVLRGELLVSYNSPTFSYPAEYSSSVGENSYSFTQVNFSVIPQVIYNFYNSDALKVYLDAGIAFTYASYPRNQFSTNYGNLTTQKNYYTLSSFWGGFPVKAGVLLNKRIEIFASYTYPVTYTQYVGFAISTQMLGLGVHYCFNKGK